MTDPVADMLTRIRNAIPRRIKIIEVPHSNFKEGIARVLKTEGYIEKYEIVPDAKLGDKKRTLKLYLKYTPEQRSVIRKIERVSKPGRRIFCKVKDIPRVLDGLGICVLSTSKGILSDKEAKRIKTGGELICKVY